MTVSGEVPVDESFDRVRETVEEHLRKDLQGKDFEIKEIFAVADDDGGDGYLFVVVVYEPSVWRPDGRRTAGFTVNLRKALWDQGERRFPVTSYVAADEYEDSVAAS